MNTIKKYLIKIVRDAVIDLPNRVEQNVIHSLFAYVGVKRVQEILDDMKKNGIEYTSLADIYALTIRKNLQQGNMDRMAAYYELLPKLDEYSKAYNIKNNE